MTQQEIKKKRFLGWYFDTPIVWRVLIALILGAIVGLAAGPSITVLQPLGTLMIKLLKVVVLPMIFFSIVVGVGGTPASKIGRIAGKILIYYTLTTAFAAFGGIVLAQLFKPGLGANLAGTAGAAIEASEAPPVSEVLLNMVPDNIVAAFAEGSFLKVLFFAVLVGLAITFLSDSENEKVRDSVQTVLKVCEGASEIMFSVTSGILEYTPVGVFALISEIFATQGLNVVGSLGKLIVLCYTGYIFQMVVVYGGLLALYKISPIKFFSKAKDFMLMAFATRSSNAVLPVSLRVAEENMGVSRTVSGFTLPFGAQINMDGEAYYQTLSIFFVANAIGVAISPAQWILLIIAVTIGTAGTAGVAGAGPVMLLAVMEMVGLSATPGSAAAAAFALILGIDVILDMGRTTANVTGDMVGTCIVAKTENLMDLEKWV